MKKKDIRHAVILLLSLILVPAAIWFAVSLTEKNEDKTARGQMTDGFGRLARMTWNGKDYVHRSDLTTVLVLGVDKNSDYQTMGYRNGGQSDFLLLLVIDHENKTIRQLQIDRDTMTDITVLTILGREAGTRLEQICLSHGFGKTEEERCGYTKKAVENLLMGEKIDLYASVRLDAIEVINDTLGGVTVTIEDDCSAYDPEMTQGKTITLHGKQAEIFVRSRYNIANGSNNARQKRQKQYLSATDELLREKVAEDQNYSGTLYDALGEALTTDMSRGRMINEIYRARDYTLEPVRGFSGEYTLGSDGYIEFHADPEDIRDFVINTFYRPV